MRASLTAMAVAYAFPLMPAFGPVAQWDQTEWPHGYHRNPFLARGPLTLAQHGQRLSVERAINGEQVVMIRPQGA